MFLIDLWLKKYFLCLDKQKNSSFLIFFITFLFVIIVTPVNASEWSQLGVDIDGEAFGDNSGSSVSLSADGRRVAIGAPYNGGTTNSNLDKRGHVRIYEYSGGSWTKLGDDIDGEATGDNSGLSVSMSADGSRVAIGAPSNQGWSQYDYNMGHVRIYEYSGGSWTKLGDDIDGEANRDGSGSSVSLSADGSRVAIGAPYNDGAESSGTDNRGHVRIYEYSGGSWTKLGDDIDGEATADESGTSVSLSADGSRVAIGAPLNDGNGTISGHVRIYEYSDMDKNWTKLGDDIDGEAFYNYSGTSVSLNTDGSRVAIGAPRNRDNGLNSGHVRIYEYNDGNWTKLGDDIDGEAADDYSGTSVSLSADGSRVAIGAPYNGGLIFGAKRGDVRIYEYSGGSWRQLNSNIDGEATGDESGSSVSLSADGSRVVIGAPLNDAIGSAGHARVYELYLACGNTSTSLIENTWWSVSRPCGLVGNPTIKELFYSPDGAGLGIYGDGNDWVMWKLDGTNPDGTEKYTMMDSSEVMKSGVGYWIITRTPGVTWNPGAIAETLDPAGATWNVATTGTVGQSSLNGINAPDVKEFLVVDPITDGGLTLVQDTQLALIGNPFPKKITWSNVYFRNSDETDYIAIDSIPSGVQPIAYVSDPDSTSGQPYKAVSSTPGFTHTIEQNQAFWIQMTGTVERHTLKRIALPLEY